MIKQIIFDFDGVIFDSEPLHLQAFNRMLSERAHEAVPTDIYFKKYLGLSDREMLPRIFDDRQLSYTEADVHEMAEAKVQHYQSILENSAHLDCSAGLPNFLQTMQDVGWQFSICSASARSEIDAALDKLEGGQLRQYFKLITSADDVSAAKPSPEGYLKTAKALGIAPEHCIVIEDSPNGIRAGKSAAMRVVALKHPTQDKSKLHEADHVAEDFTEIYQIISAK